MKPSRYAYADEKLSNAMLILATGENDVRSRIFAAFLEFHTLKEDDFPDELRKDWNWIMREITKEKPTYNHRGDVQAGSVQNTMRKIRNSTGARIARKIYDLKYKIEDYIE